MKDRNQIVVLLRQRIEEVGIDTVMQQLESYRLTKPTVAELFTIIDEDDDYER